MKLNVEYCRTNIRKYSFNSRVVSVWNTLPEYVVSSSSIHHFKVNIDKAWINEKILYDFEAHAPGSLNCFD